MGVSSMTSDQPPEVTYDRCQIQPSSVDFDIPELEDDSDQDQFADPNNLVTHHNTHQESERIRQEYFANLQNLSDNEYYTDNKQVLHNDPQKNLNNYLEKAEVRPDVRNSTAIDHLATKRIPWRVKYNEKLRKTNVFVNSIPLSVNILSLYEHYVCVTPCWVHIKGF